MRCFIFYFLLNLITANLAAQNTFLKTALRNDECFSNDIISTPDGGYVIVGTTLNPSANDQDVLLIKIDINGDTLWTKIYGDSALRYDDGYSLCLTSDSGFAITGFSEGNINAGSGVLLMKTDAAGNLQWSKIYGGLTTSTNGEVGNKILQNSDGGYTICGKAVEFGPFSGTENIYLLRTDAAGNLMWTKAYGGSMNEEGLAIDKTADGGFAVAGHSFSFNNNDEAFLMKIDSSGNLLWMKSYGGTGYEAAYSVHTLSDGGFIMAGNASSFNSQGTYDGYLVRTNMNGDTLWTRHCGQYNRAFRIFSSSVKPEGGFLVTGYDQSFSSSRRDMLMISLDSSGNILWQEVVKGNTDVNSYGIIPTPDGGAIAVGATNGMVSQVLSQVVIAKSNATGYIGCYDTLRNFTSLRSHSHVLSVTLASDTGGSAGNLPMFTTRGMTITTYCANNVGMNDETFSDEEITIFPNPAQSEIFISGIKPNQNGSIEIRDVSGRLVMSKSLEKENSQSEGYKLNVTGIESGIYFVYIIGNNSSAGKIFIKQ